MISPPALVTVLSADLDGDGPVSIGDLRRLSGGASRETWSFVATRPGAEPDPLVLQRERPGAKGTTDGMAVEAALVRAAAAAGSRCPRWCRPTDGRDDLGRLVHDRSSTSMARRFPAGCCATTTTRPPARCWPARPVPRCRRSTGWTHGASRGAGRGDQVDQFPTCSMSLGEPHPAFELGIRWLRRATDRRR